MSNIKQVHISGLAPFDVHENEPLQPKLAYFSSPVCGLHLKWLSREGSVPNEQGGRTSMYRFELTGQDSVAWPWIESFKKDICLAGGSIEFDTTFDMEA